jgi:hypothetical protein
MRVEMLDLQFIEPPDQPAASGIGGVPGFRSKPGSLSRYAVASPKLFGPGGQEERCGDQAWHAIAKSRLGARRLSEIRLILEIIAGQPQRSARLHVRRVHPAICGARIVADRRIRDCTNRRAHSLRGG